MGSLFEGEPKTATSYVTSSSEMPKWMQDAVYNQIQVATNIANSRMKSTPFPVKRVYLNLRRCSRPPTARPLQMLVSVLHTTHKGM